MIFRVFGLEDNIKIALAFFVLKKGQNSLKWKYDFVLIKKGLIRELCFF